MSAEPLEMSTEPSDIPTQPSGPRRLWQVRCDHEIFRGLQSSNFLKAPPDDVSYCIFQLHDKCTGLIQLSKPQRASYFSKWIPGTKVSVIDRYGFDAVYSAFRDFCHRQRAYETYEYGSLRFPGKPSTVTSNAVSKKIEPSPLRNTWLIPPESVSVLTATTVRVNFYRKFDFLSDLVVQRRGLVKSITIGAGGSSLNSIPEELFVTRDDGTLSTIKPYMHPLALFAAVYHEVDAVIEFYPHQQTEPASFVDGDGREVLVQKPVAEDALPDVTACVFVECLNTYQTPCSECNTHDASDRGLSTFDVVKGAHEFKQVRPLTEVQELASYQPDAKCYAINKTYGYCANRLSYIHGMISVKWSLAGDRAYTSHQWRS